jgi:hypothetical protein
MIKEFIGNFLKKTCSVKLWAAVYCAVELHLRIKSGSELGIVDTFLAAGVLTLMGLNVLQDFIFKGK